MKNPLFRIHVPDGAVMTGCRIEYSGKAGGQVVYVDDGGTVRNCVVVCRPTLFQRATRWLRGRAKAFFVYAVAGLLFALAVVP